MFGKIKRASLLLLALSVVLTAGLANASVPFDVKGSWAAKTLDDWLSKGWLHGYPDGSVKPNNKVTRAEFVTLTNNALALTGTTKLVFRDMKPGSWSYEQIAIAVKAGYIHGYDDGTMRPDRNVSREEAAVMVAAALHLDLTRKAESAFKDESHISGWAKSAVHALVAEGIASGYPDGTFQPKASIIRAEAVVLLDRAVNMSVVAYDQAGTYGPATGNATIAGNVTIGASGVTLQNTVITGNLLLAESIGEGDVYLNNVTVQGTMNVRGGGANSVHLKDAVLLTVLVDKATGDIRIVAEGKTTVKQITLRSGATLEANTASGAGFESVTLSEQLPAGSTVTLNGEFLRVEVYAPATLVVDDDAAIIDLVLDAVVKVIGQGKIDKATLSGGAKGSTFEQEPLHTESGGSSNAGSGTPSAGGGSSGELGIDKTSLSLGQVGIPYSDFFTSRGGSGARTYAITAGSLPAGLTLSAIGVITGTPSAIGESTFTVTVTDSEVATSSYAFRLAIEPQSTGLEAFNAATGIEAILALLAVPDNQAKLDLKMNPYYLLPALSRQAVASAVFGGGWDYGSSEEIKAVFDQAVALQTILLALNDAPTTDRTLEVLIASHGELNLNLSAGTGYASLSDQDREALAAVLMQKRPYSLIAQIKSAFDAALAAQSLVIAFNATANAGAAKLFIETKHAELGLKMVTYELLSAESRTAVATMTYNKGVDYVSVADIRSAFDAEVALQPIVASVNALGTFSDTMYDAIFNANESLLGLNLNTYAALADSHKSKVAHAIFEGKPYTTSATLRSVYNKEVAVQALIQYLNMPGNSPEETLQLLELSERLLGLDLSAGSAYAALSDSAKLDAVTAMLAQGPFDSVADMLSAFDAEVAAAGGH